jgi:Subtilase family
LPRRALPLFAIAAAQLAILLVATLQPPPKPLTPAQKRAERADVGGPFPLDLRSPQVVAGTSARVLVALRRPSLAELNAKTPQTPIRQRAYVRSLHKEARALISALTAKGVRFGQPVLFARVWSGFAATIATRDLPAVQTLGLRVEPVSRFYPAQVPGKAAPAVRPLPTTASGDVAVLDSFRRRSRLIDEVGTWGARRRSTAERSGDRIAAVVRGELPHARINRVRVAGSQALENGKFEVFGTTDQLIAGLERVVDPDQNGDATDAVPVAVTGLSAPYSGFETSAVAEAVDGASELGTLVVAPAGNGGDPDGPFGSIGAPGAARSALTVGALDASGDPAKASSTGPTYSLGPKPDLAIGGGARTAAGSAWGTAVAAARVAGVAGALRAERPKLSSAEAAAALVGTAAPRGEPAKAGGGDPLLQAARATPFVGLPAQVAIRPGEGTGVRIVGLTGSQAVTAPVVKGLSIRVAGNRGHQVVFIGAAAHAKPASGRIDLGPIAIPYQILDPEKPAPPLGAPHVILRAGRPDGVRFTAGKIERGDNGTSVLPVGNLVLTLTGPARRELTPPGGARDLLPGEYAYTLTDEIKSGLTPGRYRFVLRARGTAGGPVVVRRSRSFRVA